MIEFFESRTIFLTLGSIHIYWYGVMYALAFWSAYFLLPVLGKMRGIILPRDAWTSIVACGALGILLGGRLGYALFYEPVFFLSHPFELFQIWHGGMSSHGGFIGAAVALWLCVRNSLPPNWGEGGDGGRPDAMTLTAPTLTLPLNRGRGTLLLAITDVLTVPAAIGLALGRVGNIINQEFGIYPYYEAVGDVVIAIVCYALLWGARGGSRGNVFTLFLFLYSIQRFLLEYLRPQEWPLLLGLSRGQLLTIPLLILAVILLKNALKRRI